MYICMYKSFIENSVNHVLLDRDYHLKLKPVEIVQST